MNKLKVLDNGLFEEGSVMVSYNSDGNQLITNGIVMVCVERTGNDISGNPLYKVFPINFSKEDYREGNLILPKSRLAYKHYYSKGYYLIQSYNIHDDVRRFMDDLLEEYPERFKGALEAPYREENLINNKWHVVKAYYNN